MYVNFNATIYFYSLKERTFALAFLKNGNFLRSAVLLFRKEAVPISRKENSFRQSVLFGTSSVSTPRCTYREWGRGGFVATFSGVIQVVSRAKRTLCDVRALTARPTHPRRDPPSLTSKTHPPPSSTLPTLLLLAFTFPLPPEFAARDTICKRAPPRPITRRQRGAGSVLRSRRGTTGLGMNGFFFFLRVESVWLLSHE